MAETRGALHKRSTAVLSTVVMLVLVLGALLWGAHKGWTQERKQVESLLGGLEEMLSARREVAANILTVANRHLDAQDPTLAAVRADRDALIGGGLSKRSTANAALEKDAGALLSALQATPSVQADARDSFYVNSMLPQALEQSARLTEQAAYNLLAQEYNQRKAASLSGRLAGLLGVRDAEVFTSGEGSL